MTSLKVERLQMDEMNKVMRPLDEMIDVTSPEKSKTCLKFLISSFLVSKFSSRS